VGIDSDSRVRELKGDFRPMNSQEDRKFLLESLECVDAVYIFNSDEELENLVINVQANTIIVGEEYKDKEVIGYHPELSLHFFPKIDGYSTTKIIENTADR
jgi:D-beta-D-heptose 7-phosphate kinase/D-beta-D-heptose 1-phosphate adenosyltransferase